MCCDDRMAGAYNARMVADVASPEVVETCRECGQTDPSKNRHQSMPDIVQDVVGPRRVDSRSMPLPRRQEPEPVRRDSRTIPHVGPVCIMCRCPVSVVGIPTTCCGVPLAAWTDRCAENHKCSPHSLGNMNWNNIHQLLQNKAHGNWNKTGLDRFSCAEKTKPNYSNVEYSQVTDITTVRERELTLLKGCNFYHGRLAMENAKRILKPSSVGSFLLRDSSDKRFIVSLSVKTNRGTTSIRIAHHRGLFRLDCDESAHRKMPAFPSVLKLVEHYVEIGKSDKASSCVFLESSGRKDTPVLLVKPFLCKPPSLRHIARLQLNQMLNQEQKDKVLLFMPPDIETYLRDYPHKV